MKIHQIIVIVKLKYENLKDIACMSNISEPIISFMLDY